MPKLKFKLMLNTALRCFVALKQRSLAPFIKIAKRSITFLLEIPPDDKESKN